MGLNFYICGFCGDLVIICGSPPATPYHVPTGWPCWRMRHCDNASGGSLAAAKADRSGTKGEGRKSSSRIPIPHTTDDEKIQEALGLFFSMMKDLYTFTRDHQLLSVISRDLENPGDELNRTVLDSIRGVLGSRIVATPNATMREIRGRLTKRTRERRQALLSRIEIELGNAWERRTFPMRRAFLDHIGHQQMDVAAAILSELAERDDSISKEFLKDLKGLEEWKDGLARISNCQSLNNSERRSSDARLVA